MRFPTFLPSYNIIIDSFSTVSSPDNFIGKLSRNLAIFGERPYTFVIIFALGNIDILDTLHIKIVVEISTYSHNIPILFESQRSFPVFKKKKKDLLPRFPGLWHWAEFSHPLLSRNLVIIPGWDGISINYYLTNIISNKLRASIKPYQNQEFPFLHMAPTNIS